MNGGDRVPGQPWTAWALARELIVIEPLCVPEFGPFLMASGSSMCRKKYHGTARGRKQDFFLALFELYEHKTVKKFHLFDCRDPQTPAERKTLGICPLTTTTTTFTSGWWRRITIGIDLDRPNPLSSRKSK
jgi:hypothetical protein